MDRIRRLTIRNVRAIEHRVKRLPETANRDRTWMTEVEQAVALFTAAGGTLPLAPAVTDAVPGTDGSAKAERLITARWLLEELRVSLFAQQLGTAGPVSLQRIRKALAD